MILLKVKINLKKMYHIKNCNFLANYLTSVDIEEKFDRLEKTQIINFIVFFLSWIKLWLYIPYEKRSYSASSVFFYANVLVIQNELVNISKFEP